MDPNSQTFAAQVAGIFYPADASDLQSTIQGHLNDASKLTSLPECMPKAIVAPHAGYQFSGLYAAIAYHHLRANHHSIERVIIVGPAHKLAIDGLAICASEYYSTPLGDVELDTQAISKLASLPFVSITNAPFIGEHCIEVHLPFIQSVLNNVKIIPVIAGQSNRQQVVQLLDIYWDDPSTTVIISSDLSHFHDYNAAFELDTQTRHAIEMLNTNGLDGSNACGAVPLKGLCQIAADRGLRPTTIAFGNSGDTGGDKSRVVGYGAWRFDDLANADTPISLLNDLVDIATQAIGLYGVNRQIPNMPKELPIQYGNFRAAFITLLVDGNLRGCIGSIRAHRDLVTDVCENAISSAFKDQRFGELSHNDFSRLNIGISILSHSVPMQCVDQDDLLQQLRPGEDGLIITDSATGLGATFLPMVWDNLREPSTFVNALKEKAGIDKSYWSDSFVIQRYTAEKYSRDIDPTLAAKYTW